MAIAVGLCGDDQFLAELLYRLIESPQSAPDLTPMNLRDSVILLKDLGLLQSAIAACRAVRHAFTPPATEYASEESLDYIPDLRHAGLPSGRSKRFESSLKHLANRVDYLQLLLGVR